MKTSQILMLGLAALSLVAHSAQGSSLQQEFNMTEGGDYYLKKEGHQSGLFAPSSYHQVRFDPVMNQCLHFFSRSEELDEFSHQPDVIPSKNCRSYFVATAVRSLVGSCARRVSDGDSWSARGVLREGARWHYLLTADCQCLYYRKWRQSGVAAEGGRYHKGANYRQCLPAFDVETQRLIIALIQSGEWRNSAKTYDSVEPQHWVTQVSESLGLSPPQSHDPDDDTNAHGR